MINEGKITILASGGIDSTSCIHLLKSQGYFCEALFVDYGQPAAHLEEKHSQIICDFYELPLRKIKLEFEPNKQFQHGEITGRNSMLISVALMNIEKPGLIAIGIHSGTSYYDCSKDFFERSKQLIDNLGDGQISLIAPFLDFTKGQIIHYAESVNLPIGKTYSCEKGLPRGCGECLSCLDRESFYVSKEKNYTL